MFRNKSLLTFLILALSIAILVPSVSAASADSSATITDETLTTAPVDSSTTSVDAKVTAAPADSSKKVVSGALTAAPPASDFVAKVVLGNATTAKSGTMSAAATSSSSYKYLNPSACSSIMNALTPGVLKISGISQAGVIVSEIGATVYLQRYDGTNWNTIAYGASQLLNNTYVTSIASNMSSMKGYYFRTMTYHWVSNGVYEDATSYSPAALITQ